MDEHERSRYLRDVLAHRVVGDANGQFVPPLQLLAKSVRDALKSKARPAAKHAPWESALMATYQLEFLVKGKCFIN